MFGRVVTRYPHETGIEANGFTLKLKPILFYPVSFEEWREGASVDRNEQELVQRCLTGDQVACTELVAAYARLVGSVIWRATGDNNAVDDLVQDVFLRVFQGLRNFGGRAKLSTWIYTIAHRVAIDHLRQVGRWQEGLRGSHDDDVAQLLDRLPAPTVINPEVIAMQEQVGDLVRSGLAQLPDKYRLPLVYISLDGLDYATVAEMLGVPQGTVKTRVFRGKYMLKVWIVAKLRWRSKAGKVSDAM